VPASDALTLLLFYAARELLFNVVKHAQVNRAQLEVRHRDGYVHLIVSDPGVGFDPTTVQAGGGGGVGLLSIRERLHLLGGCMDTAGTPGHGCRITLAAPVEPGGAHPVPPPSGRQGVQGVTAVAPGRPRKLRVLIVDDHTVVRQGLALALHQDPDIEVVGEAASGQRAVDLARELHPDVITMDISMPGMDGIEATRLIHAEASDIRIIGLSMYEARDQAAAICAAGAERSLTKSGPTEALLAAVRSVR
jgi:CheY-like chemotaxis protein